MIFMVDHYILNSCKCAIIFKQITKPTYIQQQVVEELFQECTIWSKAFLVICYKLIKSTRTNLANGRPLNHNTCASGSTNTKYKCFLKLNIFNLILTKLGLVLTPSKTAMFWVINHDSTTYCPHDLCGSLELWRWQKLTLFVVGLLFELCWFF